jgi:hypothetical protein
MGPGAMLGAGGRGGHLAAGEEGPEGGVPLARLPGSVRAEVEALVARSGGLLKVEDFDEGVVHQLAARRSEAEAVAAVRSIAQYELGSIQHMAAYLNHIIKHYMPPGAGDGQQSTGRMVSGWVGSRAACRHKCAQRHWASHTTPDGSCPVYMHVTIWGYTLHHSSLHPAQHTLSSPQPQTHND